MNQESYLDASAVLAFFQSTQKRHLFLTGSRGSGKSFLCRALEKALSRQARGADLPHLYSKKTEDGRVLLQAGSGSSTSEAVIGRLSKSSSADGLQRNTNQMTLVAEGFLTCGIPAIEAHCTAADTFFVIDELGYLESSCPPFLDAVRRLLGTSRTLAVLRKQSTPFLDELRSRDDALVLDLDQPFQSLACILMASGLGQRFGSNKLLADFGGRPLFETALRISHFAGFGARLTVTRYPQLAGLVREWGDAVLLHDLPDRNDTVRLGVSALLQTGRPDGILFLPGDQPLLSRSSLQQLCLSFLSHKDRICRLSYQGTGAAPMIFPSDLFEELLTLPARAGGGYLAKKYPEKVLLVPVLEEKELEDIDTPADLARLLGYIRQ